MLIISFKIIETVRNKSDNCQKLGNCAFNDALFAICTLMNNSRLVHVGRICTSNYVGFSYRACRISNREKLAEHHSLELSTRGRSNQQGKDVYCSGSSDWHDRHCAVNDTIYFSRSSYELDRISSSRSDLSARFVDIFFGFELRNKKFSHLFHKNIEIRPFGEAANFFRYSL